MFLPGKWSFYVSRLVGDQFSKCLINSKSGHKVGHFGINLQGCKNLQEEYAIGGFLKVRTKCCWSHLIDIIETVLEAQDGSHNGSYDGNLTSELGERR